MTNEETVMKEKENNEKNYNYIQGTLLSHCPPGEEIVISGLAGTFPNSNDIYHFQHNLFNKINMVLPNRRFDYKHPEVPVRSGTIPVAVKYDAGFFGVHRNQGDAQDPMSRILLSQVVEALFDAGLTVEDIEGTNTGVYVGTCFSESEKSVFGDQLGPDVKQGFSGCLRSSLPNRISYFLKLKGPSFVTDTACSSSLFAVEAAFRDIRRGLVDTAIVCGANMCFHPFVFLQFARLGVLSLDGSCKVFDETGNGYARSEAVNTMILQKSKVAMRKYSELVYIKTNCDGFKEAGITYPSGAMQRQLLTEFYNESKINPADLSFLEAHGTGTFVGDPEECAGIDEVLAKCRSDPLLIGSVKSNIGHSEPASGICSIIKCIIGTENGYIPPNLHFTTPRDSIRGIVEGRMEVVTEKRPFNDKRGLIGINSFGFGGGNCHLLLKANNKEKINKGIPNDDIPRVTCVSGRTPLAIVSILDELQSLDSEYIRLIHNIFRKNIPNHLYRGYSIVSKVGEICRFFEHYPGSKTTMYFAFGELSEWYEFGRQLMVIPTFDATIEKAQRLLLSKGINVREKLLGDFSDPSKNQTLGSVLVQLGLIEIFKTLQLQPTNYFGYSFGELLAAYFDNILTFKQTIECAFAINEVVDKINYLYTKRDNKMMNGSFINSGETIENVGILENFRSSFKSPEFASLRKQLLANLSNVLEKPEKRKAGKDIEKFGTADYFISALANNFSDKYDYVEKNSIVLKVGVVPSLGNDIEDVKIIPLLPPKETNYLVGFLKVLGNLYVNGYNPQLAKLYPEISFPVSRGTRMISPFIKWEHKRNWFVPNYNLEATNTIQEGARSIKVAVSDQTWSFVTGHVVDGRNLFPATGYLFLVWESLCTMENTPFTVKHIIFEDVKFLRATTLSKNKAVKLEIAINRFSGNFEIVEGNSTVVSGKIYSGDTKNLSYYGTDEIEKYKYTLTSKDVYKELRLRGYNYSGEFRGIQEFNPVKNSGLIKWNDNWIAFMDNMLQLRILTTDTRLLYVPTYIAYMEIPAKSFQEWINRSFLLKQKEPILPVFVNEDTNEIKCGTITIKGLVASSIARKKDLGIPVLETYQFVPNITNLELEESMRVNMQIMLENSLVKKVKCIEIVDEFTENDSILLPTIQSVLEDQPLIQPWMKVLSKKTLTDVPEAISVQDDSLHTETDCNLIIGSRLTQRSKILSTAFECLKTNGFIISREALQFDLSTVEVKEFTIFTVHTTPTETIVLLSKNIKTKELVTVDVESSEDFLWIKPLQEIIKSKKNDNVLLYAQNKSLSGILGLVNCLKREPESQYIRCLFMLDNAEKFDTEKPFYKEQLNKNMAINIWKDNSWGTYRHLLLKKQEKVVSQHCFVNSTNRGDLSSLKWIESTFRTDMVVPPEKKLVYVHYGSLNFRDVMTASGRINTDVITQDRIEQECVQGFEFSGYTFDGRRVMGMVPHGALSTLMLADEFLLFDVPDGMSLLEAATIPVVYATVIFGLITRGQIKKGESILIHSGTGGIGQAAIRLALHYECNVFATVGTIEKREYLLNMFPQLKPNQIGNSHDISFELMVRKATSGRGVDLVLNSLAEEKLQASLRCLAKGGRFIEIGKFDLANNNVLNLLLLEKEASFHGVMLDQLFYVTPEIKREIVEILLKNIGKFVVPLPVTCFGYNQVEEAFRFMSTGKHMGKVTIKIREEETPPKAEPEKFVGIPRYLCLPEKTYIIVGGLGGFGLELADWLVLRGAKNLVLNSRTGVSTGYQSMRLRLWESYGIIVEISKDDVCSEEGCRNLLQNAKKLGEIHSIFNLGVVLADGMFENQTDQNFKISFAPKALATQHLDRLSRTLCPELKEFVIFSSVTCGRGNAGQTNYGMANSIMERICEKRKMEGYPALAIQWGAIGDVGLVAEMQEEHIELEIGGTLQQKISNCLNVLNTFLRQKDATIVSSVVVAEKRGGLDSCNNVVDMVINILGLSDPKSVSHHVTLPELGMDSMTGVEIKQTLEREFEIFLTPKDMKIMTLAKLKQIQEEKCLAPEDEQDNNLLFTFADMGDVQEMKLVEVELTSKLTEDSDGPYVLMFPGIEGFAKKFITLAEHLEARVIVYQYWNDYSKYTTIQELALSLLPKIERRIKKDGTFIIVGYSFGSLVAAEIIHILETAGYVGNFVIIDGGSMLMKKVAQSWMQDSDHLFQTNVLCHLLSFYLPTGVIAKDQERLFKCVTWDERLNLSAEIMKAVNSSEDTLENQRRLADGLYTRTKSCIAYIQSFQKLKSRISLYKPTKTIIRDIEEDYGLSVITDSELEMTVFEGDHTNILNNEELGHALNLLIQKVNEKSDE